MTEILSNAYNFSNPMVSGVDPRTGSYHISINMGEFLSHKTSGVSLSLILNYNAASSFDMGFGRGWGLTLSSYNKATNMLSLSTGQSFKIEYNSALDEYDIPYRKLKDLRVFYLSSTNELKVVHKDGRSEFIDYSKGTLNRIVSHHGLSVYFSYQYHNNYLVLTHIYDNAGRELSIDWYSDPWKTRVEHWIDDKLYQCIEFNKIANGAIYKRLSSINFPGYTSNTQLEYSFVPSVGYDLIEKVTHLSGLIEEMTYKNLGMALPRGAPFAFIPCVIQYRMKAGEQQPDTLIQYEYSDKNFLGFASDRTWRAGEDTLFTANKHYQYTSKEIINGSESVFRTYNKYHLLDKAEYLKNNILYKKEENLYFANLDLSIDAQPAQYSFIKKEIITNYNGGQSKQRYSEYDYDEYGNQLFIKNVDGSEIHRVFYSKDGEGNYCPADPNGMRSLLKQEIWYPISRDHSEKPRYIDMRYQKLARLDDPNTYTVVLHKQQRHDQSMNMQYYNNRNKPYEYGRLKEQQWVVNGHITRSMMEYNFNQQLLIKTKLEGHDGLMICSSEVIRYADGQRVEQTNADGVITRYSYDDAGRLSETCYAPDTDYEAKSSCNYMTGRDINTIIVTDVRGNIETKRLNNAGKVIKISQTDAEGIERIINKSIYDKFGLLITQESTDWIGEQPIRLETHYQYDSFGQVNKIIHPDGREENINQDPVTLITTYEMTGLLKDVTEYNLSGFEIAKKTYDDSSQLLAKTDYQYDGYGNLIRTTDTRGRVTKQRYDESNRVISTERMLGNEKVAYQFNYANFTIDPLLTKIAVNNQAFGEQQYDGLSRLTAQISASNSKALFYTHSLLMPSLVKTAEEDFISIRNNIYLQAPFAISAVGGGMDTRCQYEYDHTSGLPIKDQSENAQSEQQYNPLGQLISESVRYLDGEARTMTYQYTLMGLPISITDYFGHTTNYIYDHLGRLKSLSTSMGEKNTNTTISYDQFSRPILFDTLNKSGDKVSIELTLNTLGLETNRQVQFNQENIFTLAQRFNDNLQIVEKIYRDDEGETRETMEYDDLDRLITYTSVGPNSPYDEYHNQIERQCFNYDTNNNMTRIRTDYIDGSHDIAIMSYSLQNPVQLMSISHTHPDYIAYVQFYYDRVGNLLSDDKGRKYHYNELGQMVRVEQQGKTLSEYVYNAQGQVTSQTQDSAWLELYYQGDILANEYLGGTYTSYHRSRPSMTIGRYISNQAQDLYQRLLPNAQGSILSILTEQSENEIQRSKHQYTPYGEDS